MHTVLTAFQARQQAQAAQASQIPNPAPEPISAKSAYSKVQDELLEGPSFTEAAKLSSRFRAGLNQMPSNGNADDDAAENSPYDVNPEEVEASLAKYVLYNMTA